MSGRILICDTSLAGRITLRARIEAAGYGVDCAQTPSDAIECLNKTPSDLIILVARQQRGLTSDLATLRALGATPIITLLARDLEQARLKVLQAGADDVQTQPISEALLLARIRAIMRGQAAERDLHPEIDTLAALGFAEDAPPALTPSSGRIALLSADEERGTKLSASVRTLTRAKVIQNAISPAPKRVMPPQPDVLLIDAQDQPASDILRLVSELRSAAETRQAMQLVLFPPGAAKPAATALDMGADDVICDNSSFAEIAHRCGQLMRRKLQSDRFRDTLQNGLQAAVTDPLTGLHNRRFALSQLYAMCNRVENIAVLLLDLDHFKRINDTFGHATGDDVLVTLASRLRKSLRPSDLIARLGGEEFLIALPGMPRDGAEQIGQRLCRALEAEPFHSQPDRTPITVTASIGIACSTRLGDSPERLIAAADAALYEAKSRGRNRIHCTAA